jgi:hypothetical protein
VYLCGRGWLVRETRPEASLFTLSSAHSLLLLLQGHHHLAAEWCKSTPDENSSSWAALSSLRTSMISFYEHELRCRQSITGTSRTSDDFSHHGSRRGSILESPLAAPSSIVESARKVPHSFSSTSQHQRHPRTDRYCFRDAQSGRTRSGQPVVVAADKRSGNCPGAVSIGQDRQAAWQASWKVVLEAVRGPSTGTGAQAESASNRSREKHTGL